VSFISNNTYTTSGLSVNLNIHPAKEGLKDKVLGSAQNPVTIDGFDDSSEDESVVSIPVIHCDSSSSSTSSSSAPVKVVKKQSPEQVKQVTHVKMRHISPFSPHRVSLKVGKKLVFLGGFPSLSTAVEVRDRALELVEEGKNAEQVRLAIRGAYGCRSSGRSSGSNSTTTTTATTTTTTTTATTDDDNVGKNSVSRSRQHVNYAEEDERSSSRAAKKMKVAAENAKLKSSASLPATSTSTGDKDALLLPVHNTCDLPINCGTSSSFHTVNAMLVFDRVASMNMRLIDEYGEGVRFLGGSKVVIKLVDCRCRRKGGGVGGGFTIVESEGDRGEDKQGKKDEQVVKQPPKPVPEADARRNNNLPHRQQKFKKDDQIDARWKGLPTWYPGDITRVNPDGTYDVLFTDGEVEYNVKSEFIKLYVPEDDWSNADPCEGCGEPCDTKTIICDGCDGEWHFKCVRPVIEEVPEGDWFCERCRKKKKIYADDAAAADENDDDDGDDDDDVHQEWDPCEACGKPGDKTTLICDSCDGEYHLKCAALKEVPKGDWFCSHCTVPPKSVGRFGGGAYGPTPLTLNLKASTPLALTQRGYPNINRFATSEVEWDPCAECGEPGDKSTLICDWCEQEYHLKCAKLTKIPEGDWYCKDCKLDEKDKDDEDEEEVWDPCEACGKPGDTSTLICDGCDGEWHMHCARVDEVPPGAWFCVRCVEPEIYERDDVEEQEWNDIGQEQPPSSLFTEVDGFDIFEHDEESGVNPSSAINDARPSRAASKSKGSVSIKLGPADAVPGGYRSSNPFKALSQTTNTFHANLRLTLGGDEIGGEIVAAKIGHFYLIDDGSVARATTSWEFSKIVYPVSTISLRTVGDRKERFITMRTDRADGFALRDMIDAFELLETVTRTEHRRFKVFSGITYDEDEDGFVLKWT
jgi:urease beta subunit